MSESLPSLMGSVHNLISPCYIDLVSRKLKRGLWGGHPSPLVLPECSHLGHWPGDCMQPNTADSSVMASQYTIHAHCPMGQTYQIPAGTFRHSLWPPRYTMDISSVMGQILVAQYSKKHSVYLVWSHLVVDFISDLPESVNTVILVIKDQFSKTMHLIPLPGLPIVFETEWLLFN